MTLQQLAQRLQSEGIPWQLYSIGKEVEETKILLYEGGAWLIFDYERGGRSAVERYTAEEEACGEYYLKIVRRFETFKEFFARELEEFQNQNQNRTRPPSVTP